MEIHFRETEFWNILWQFSCFSALLLAKLCVHVFVLLLICFPPPFLSFWDYLHLITHCVNVNKLRSGTGISLCKAWYKHQSSFCPILLPQLTVLISVLSFLFLHLPLLPTLFHQASAAFSPWPACCSCSWLWHTFLPTSTFNCNVPFHY